MSTTKRKQSRTRTVGGSTRAVQRRKVEASLTRLAHRIKQAHQDAERAQYDSLSHARRAGQLLIEAKEQVPYGEWGGWLEQHCEFAESTAGLYVKVAREWDRLADSQRVRKLTLRQAGQLLYAREEDDSQVLGEAAAYPEAQELFALGVLEPSDLDGLSATQVQTLVTEVLQADADFCDERWQARLANATEDERPALERKLRTVPVLIDRVKLRLIAQETAQKLRQGKVGHPAVRGLVRPDLRLKKHVPFPHRPGDRPLVLQTPRSIKHPDDALPQYQEMADRFHAETMALVQDGKADRRFTITERDALRHVCREVRQALNALEELVAGSTTDEPVVAEPNETLPDVVNIGEPGELVAVE